jgi:RNA recognition motif-containing protein
MSNHNYGSDDPNGPRKRDRDWSNDGPPAKRQRDESSTVFLGNLAPDVTEEQIATTFGRCGGIREIRLKRHDDTGKGKGNVPGVSET